MEGVKLKKQKNSWVICSIEGKNTVLFPKMNSLGTDNMTGNLLVIYSLLTRN